MLIQLLGLYTVRMRAVLPKFQRYMVPPFQGQSHKHVPMKHWQHCQQPHGIKAKELHKQIWNSKLFLITSILILTHPTESPDQGPKTANKWQNNTLYNYSTRITCEVGLDNKTAKLWWNWQRWVQLYKI
jgi:hypothetical protein